MNSIKILDPLTANQIAAGEVVERPASVVKELLENAIDAGASRISVLLAEGGLQLIRVVDNGRGMTPDDLVLATLRHATSKISSADDLNRLQTLGFRGEALPSIAAVSHLTIRTRTSGDPVGWQIRVEAGQAERPEETGCPTGTLVLVEDLFFNTPARKKFLKTSAAELAQISDLLGRMAMSRPDIAFELQEGNRVLLKTPGQGDLVQAVCAVYSSEVARQLAAVAGEGEITIHGLVSRPELTRSSRLYYSFFINGRLVRSSELAAVLEDAFYTRIPARRYPLAVVHFTMPPDLFDVNVHPAKMEVKFRQPQQVRESFARALAGLFRPAVLIPAFISPQQPAAAVPPQAAAGELDPALPLAAGDRGQEDCLGVEAGLGTGGVICTAPPAVSGQAGSQAAPAGPECRMEDIGGRRDPSSALPAGLQPPAVQPFAVKPPAVQPITVQPSAAHPGGEAGLSRETAAPRQENMDFAAGENDRIFSAFRIIGQLDGAYILAEGPEGLYIVDQHAAHERVRYEEISRQFAAQPAAYELLAVPTTLELTPQQAIWLVEHIIDLADLGFILEHFGDNTFLLRGTPRWNQGGNSADLLLSVLDELGGEKGSFNLQRWAESRIFSLACKGAVKANQYLPAGEISHLLQRLEESGNPYTCPHGRPVMIKLSREEIRKRFLRS